MELNEEEKRQLCQVDGDCQAKVLDELYMQCMALVQDLQKNYHLPYPRTMGERIPLARQQSGAEKYIKYMTDLF